MSLAALNAEAAANRRAGLGGSSRRMISPEGYTVEIIALNGTETFLVTLNGAPIGGAAGFKGRGLTTSIAHVAALLGDSFPNLQEVTSS